MDAGYGPGSQILRRRVRTMQSYRRAPLKRPMTQAELPAAPRSGKNRL